MYPLVTGRSSKPGTFYVHCQTTSISSLHMTQALHSRARTTHLIREEIKNSTLSQAELARLYNVSRQTIRKWQDRDSVDDVSHRPNTMRTTLTPEQELVVVELRRTLLLPTDDLLSVTHELINPAVSRVGLGGAACAATASRACSHWPRKATSQSPRSLQGLRALLFTYGYQVDAADVRRNGAPLSVRRHR